MEKLTITPGKEELAQEAARSLAQAAAQAIASRGRFTLALSGGSTPEGLYLKLAGPEFAGQIDWPRVFVFWGDERAVPPDDPQSNYGMAKRVLLDHVGIPPENIFRLQGELPPAEAARAYENVLRSFIEAPDLASSPRATFDLTLLGLGADGHTASLFPRTEALKERERWVVANYVGSLGSWRLTLTLPAINRSRQVWFLAAGPDKAGRVAQVVAGTPAGEALPAQLIRPETGRLRWFLDQAAASGLATKK
jgi:6-phosphogluconolactonase